MQLVRKSLSGESIAITPSFFIEKDGLVLYREGKRGNYFILHIHTGMNNGMGYFSYAKQDALRCFKKLTALTDWKVIKSPEGISKELAEQVRRIIFAQN